MTCRDCESFLETPRAITTSPEIRIGICRNPLHDSHDVHAGDTYPLSKPIALNRSDTK